MACFTLQITGDNVDFDWVDLPVSLEIDAESQPVIEDDNVDLFTGSYTDDLVYNVTFPNTFKNYKVLGGVMSGANYKMDRREINIVAIYNGEVMYVDRMYAKRNGFNDDGRFEVQLYKSKSWVKLASDKKIKDVEISVPIQQNSANIDLLNAYGAKWEDGQIPIRFPLVLRKDKLFTGRNIYESPEKYFIVESDLLPYVSLLALLRKCFISIGWSFKCPILESDAGRRIWVDLTRDILPFNYSTRVPLEINGGVVFYGVSLGPTKWSEFPMFGNRKNFTISGNIIITQGTTDLEDSAPTTDNSPWYSNNKYTEPVVIDIAVSMRVKRIAPVVNMLFKGDIEIEVRLKDQVIYTHPDFITDANLEISFTVEEVDVNEREFLNFVFKMRATDRGGFVQVTDILVKETKLHYRYLNKAHLYKINDLFNPTDSVYDVLRGFAQMVYGKIHKNEATREVTLYTPLDFELFEEPIEGYYKDDMVTLTNIARLSINSNDDERKRYLQLAFADSYDNVIKELYPDDDKYLQQFSMHGTFVDFGDKYEKSVEEYKNKYFVPTYTPENTFHLCPIAAFEKDTYKNKGRRIVYALGNISIAKRQRVEAGVVIEQSRNIKVKYWSRDNDYVNPFWAFQSVNEEIYTFPNGTEFLHLAFSTKKTYPSYVDTFPNLYDLICKDHIVNLITSQGGTVWKYMKATEFSNFDKRKRYVFNVKDQVIICNVVKIDGYRPCEEGIVGLNFLISDKFRISPMATSTPPTNELPYDPNLDFSIDVERVDCTYFITINY